MTRPGYLLAAALCLLSAACVSKGSDDGLAVRKLSWFSYLNGDDLKADCTAAAPERLRLVFNADYADHVRTYDLTVDPKSGGAQLMIRVMTAANLADLSSGSLLDPWRGKRLAVTLSPEQSATLQGRITRSGAFDDPPVGLTLPSTEYYWLVTGCHLGHGFLNALPLTGGAEEPPFVHVLAKLDKTGIPFPDLAAHQRRLAHQPPVRPNDPSLTFTIRIGKDGLSGLLPR